MTLKGLKGKSSVTILHDDLRVKGKNNDRDIRPKRNFHFAATFIKIEWMPVSRKHACIVLTLLNPTFIQ